MRPQPQQPEKTPRDDATVLETTPSPRAGGAEAQRKADTPPARPPAAGRRALIVDDNALVAKLLSAMLGRLGWDSDRITDPRDVHDALAARRYDLVITDYAMPGLTGSDIARRLAPLRGAPPVVLVTGRDHLPPGAVGADVHAVIRKPFCLEDIAATLARLPEGA